MMTRVAGFVCLYVSVLVAVPVAAQAPVTVKGRVVQDEGGQPVADARVEIEGPGQATVAGPNGAFTQSGVSAGTLTVIVSREGFETVRSRVTVAAGETVSFDVRLPFRVSLREEIIVAARTVGELGLVGTTRNARRAGPAGHRHPGVDRRAGQPRDGRARVPEGQ